jgi:hypothetical protein
MKKIALILPKKCSFCPNTAVFDCPTRLGRWAYLCSECFEEYKTELSNLLGFTLIYGSVSEDQKLTFTRDLRLASIRELGSDILDDLGDYQVTPFILEDISPREALYILIKSEVNLEEEGILL